MKVEFIITRTNFNEMQVEIRSPDRKEIIRLNPEEFTLALTGQMVETDMIVKEKTVG